jgi:type IV pilus assembly protein PilQ
MKVWVHRGLIVAGLAVQLAAVSMATAQQRGTDPKAEKAPQFPALAIEKEAPRYTGELITLSLKDADIRDVIKTFAVLTDLNMVVDPSVKGSVTLELRDVPWDQAFELILQINGLAFHMTNNVVYVAPLAKLARVPLG